MARTPSTIPNASKVASPLSVYLGDNETHGEEIENLEATNFMDELNGRLSAIEKARVGLRSGVDTKPALIQIPEPSAGGPAGLDNQNASFYREFYDIMYPIS